MTSGIQIDMLPFIKYNIIIINKELKGLMAVYRIINKYLINKLPS